MFRPPKITVPSPENHYFRPPKITVPSPENHGGQTAKIHQKSARD